MDSINLAGKLLLARSALFGADVFPLLQCLPDRDCAGSHVVHTVCCNRDMGDCQRLAIKLAIGVRDSGIMEVDSDPIQTFERILSWCWT